MIRSMYSAISGLRGHQQFMDVIGNNIANVNTAGFKSSNVVFSDILHQTSRGAGAATVNDGGTNPTSVGLGSRVSSITTSFAQGAFQTTGRATDVGISGDGFFVVKEEGTQMFTRNGSFSVDALGRIVTQEGAFVQGWQASPQGVVNSNAPITNVVVPVGGILEPVRTQEAVVGGNLPSDEPVGTQLTSNVNVYDAQGNAVELRIEFEKTGADAWSAVARYVDANGVLQPTPPAAGQAITNGALTFDANGELTSSYDMTLAAGFLPGFPSDAIAISLGEAGGIGRISQYGGVSSMAFISQNGGAAGSLAGFSTSQEGLIVGSYTNGLTRPIGQLAMAGFTNPEGLEKLGGNMWVESVNSGLAQIGAAGSAGRGLIAAGVLEMSNVDLAEQFTNLIVAQRGFQANSRVITTSDEMLQELVNLKR